MTPDKNASNTNNTEEQMETIIKNAAKLDRQHSIEVSDTEAAYQKVAREAGIGSQGQAGSNYFKYAAAAVILIGLIAAGYLLTPRHVQVPHGQISTLNLPDGTTVTLNSGSELSYPRWFNIWGRSVTLNGEAFFDVPQNGSTFRVQAGPARVTVMGTKFNVRSWDNGRTSVYLKEGSIAFSADDGKSKTVILQPGEYSWISEQKLEPAAPETTKASKAIAWMQDGLSFENQPLEAIFSEISRRFDVKVKVKSSQIAKEKLTIYLSRIKDAEQAINDICRAKGLQYSRNGDVFIITKSI